MKKSVLPELSAHGAEGVAERQVPLGIPGGAPGAEMAASDEVVSPEGDKGEQRQQGRRGAGDGLVGPLALSFNTEVAPNLFERYLDRPAPDEPAQDVQGVGLLIGAQERLRIVFTFDVAHQYPADRDTPAGMVPHGSAGQNIQLPPALAIPLTDRDAAPCCWPDRRDAARGSAGAGR